jgi:hypothetical protein
MYVIGKGQSETTISASQVQVIAGQKAVITGVVIHLSPAQTGKAFISQDSMSTYMEYLHMQAPIDGYYHNITITGVPITIYVVDPNGNSRTLGTVTSNSKGTFAYQWTPKTAGKYKITATFAGDDSYGSSWPDTYATVAQASNPTSSTNMNDVINPIATYIVAAAIAIIIAIAIVGALILRKH